LLQIFRLLSIYSCLASSSTENLTMRLQVHFVKASGAGNDFVVLNNLDGQLGVDQSALARALCSRHSGIGADGLLVLEPSAKADFKMRYFNADGSSGGMCGNGGRCIALAAWLSGLVGRRCRFEALDFVYEAIIEEGRVRLSMKDPRDFRPDIAVDVGGVSYMCHAIDTGAPHAVVFVPDIESIDVDSVGRSLRNAHAFHPEGTNVDFVRLTGGASIEMRTYERGVEAETLACGTGSIASAAVSCYLHGLRFPVDVHVRSGEILRINANAQGGPITNVILEGPAVILFQGKIQYDSTSRSIVGLGSELSSWGNAGGVA
jgi:diaminopimelate epimerase